MKKLNSIHIEITNACRFSCTNCSKFIGHHTQPHFMELKIAKQAIESLEGYQGGIAITGGEPTLHPDFAEVCKYLRRKVPPDQRYLQTTGYKWEDYKSIIKKTFLRSHIQYNNHKDVTEKHHPMMVAIKDVVADDSLRSELIDKCWVRERWSALINAKGCFSCEIAGSFDALYNGPGGHPIENGWWAKSHDHFNDQMERYCYQCGAALPQPAVTLKDKKDHVSISNYRILKKLQTPKFKKNRVMLVEHKYSEQDVKKITETWEPWLNKGENYISQQDGGLIRNFLRHRLVIQYFYKLSRKFVRLARYTFWRLCQKFDYNPP